MDLPAAGEPGWQPSKADLHSVSFLRRPVNLAQFVFLLPASSLSTLQSIQRTDDAGGAGGGDVGIDHRGFQAGVAQQFLDGADIGAGFQQVGGERVPQGVAGDAFVDAAAVGGALDGLLNRVFVDVVSSPLVPLVDQLTVDFAGSGVAAQTVGGKQVLPMEGSRGVGVLAVKGVGHPDPAGPGGDVPLVLVAHCLLLLLEVAGQTGG